LLTVGCCFFRYCQDAAGVCQFAQVGSRDYPGHFPCPTDCSCKSSVSGKCYESAPGSDVKYDCYCSAPAQYQFCPVPPTPVPPTPAPPTPVPPTPKPVMYSCNATTGQCAQDAHGTQAPGDCIATCTCRRTTAASTTAPFRATSPSRAATCAPCAASRGSLGRPRAMAASKHRCRAVGQQTGELKWREHELGFLLTEPPSTYK
jgi:hypothetical protein